MSDSAGAAPSATEDSRPDPLNTEYIYYMALLKALAISCGNPSTTKRASLWVTKLFGPEYGSSLFKEKRNRYLCSLCICLINNELAGVFHGSPPEGALAEVDNIDLDPVTLAAWEVSTQWEETLQGIRGLPAVFSQVPCHIHTAYNANPDNRACPRIPNATSSMFDQEFRFCLYLARPFVALIPLPEDKSKAAAWMQVLCTVDTGSCPVMKSVRNEYIQSLLGYVSDLRVAGPFVEYPLWGRLYPLADAAQFAAYKHPFTDPTSRDSEDFIKSQTIPTTGAFCYVALTGELIHSSVPVAKPKKKTRQKSRRSAAASTSHQQSEHPPRTSLSMTLDLDKLPAPVGASTPKRTSLVITIDGEAAKGTDSPAASFLNQMR